jgi:hypothetical protein
MQTPSSSFHSVVMQMSTAISQFFKSTRARGGSFFLCFRGITNRPNHPSIVNSQRTQTSAL